MISQTGNRDSTKKKKAEYEELHRRFVMVADELNREKVTVFGGCVSRSGVLPGGLE
jgi:hypothetical protein